MSDPALIINFDIPELRALLFLSHEKCIPQKPRQNQFSHTTSNEVSEVGSLQGLAFILGVKLSSLT